MPITLQIVSAMLAAFSVSAIMLVLFWPRALSRKALRRVDSIAGRHAVDLGPGAGAEVSLRPEARKIYKNIVERLRLEILPEDSPLVGRLRMAGYRGEGPVVTFLAARVLAPIVLFGVSLFYVFVVLQPDASPSVKFLIALGFGFLGWYAPSLFVSNKVQKRQKAIGRVWPDALDLMLICVESGMGMDSALRRVADEMASDAPEMAEELELLLAELSYLPERRKAYENLAARTGIDSVKAAMTTLMQAEKYGTQIGVSLRVLARESRDARLAAAEQKAAALPPKLTVPMILFFLPVLFVVIITPAVIQVMRIM